MSKRLPSSVSNILARTGDPKWEVLSFAAVADEQQIISPEQQRNKKIIRGIRNQLSTLCNVTSLLPPPYPRGKQEESGGREGRRW